MIPSESQFTEGVKVIPAGSKPKTKGDNLSRPTPEWSKFNSEALGTKINSIDGKTAPSRPAPGGGWGIPDKYK
jgi:hypothetical protein